MVGIFGAVMVLLSVIGLVMRLGGQRSDSPDQYDDGYF